jgi:hypothetical protein
MLPEKNRKDNYQSLFKPGRGKRKKAERSNLSNFDVGIFLTGVMREILFVDLTKIVSIILQAWTAYVHNGRINL